MEEVLSNTIFNSLLNVLTEKINNLIIESSILSHYVKLDVTDISMDEITLTVTIFPASAPTSDLSIIMAENNNHLISMKNLILTTLEPSEYRLDGTLDVIYYENIIILTFKIQKADTVNPSGFLEDPRSSTVRSLDTKEPPECEDRCPVPKNSDLIPENRDPTRNTFKPYEQEMSPKIPILTYDLTTMKAPGTITSPTYTNKGKLLFGMYMKRLGSGTFGDVSLYQDKNNKQYAIKALMVASNEGLQNNNIREISILRRLNHPLIIDLIGLAVPELKEFKVHFSGDSNNNGNEDGLDEPFDEKSIIGMVMPALQGDMNSFMKFKEVGNITFSTRKLTENDRLRYAYQVIAGVAYIHSRDVIHRDLKPQNILYRDNDDTFVLADFGLARALSCPYAEGKTHEVQTLWYRSPEVLLGANEYNYPADVWSVGAIIYFILTGTDLFSSGSEQELMSLIFKTFGIPTEESWPGVTSLHDWSNIINSRIINSPDTKNLENFESSDKQSWINLLKSALILNPKKRASIFDLLDDPMFDFVRDPSLESPYINCLDNLYLRENPMIVDLKSHTSDLTSLKSSSSPSSSDSPLSLAENISNLNIDNKKQLSPNRFIHAPDVNPKMRMILLDWLIEVHRMFKLRHITFAMMQYLIDTYLPINIPRAELQLFGVSCLNLASVYMVIYST